MRLRKGKSLISMDVGLGGGEKLVDKAPQLGAEDPSSEARKQTLCSSR